MRHAASTIAVNGSRTVISIMPKYMHASHWAATALPNASPVRQPGQLWQAL